MNKVVESSKSPFEDLEASSRQLADFLTQMNLPVSSFVVFLSLNFTMKKSNLTVLLITCLFLLTGTELMAQCSICTKTAQQLGEGPAKGMNTGILYLAFAPMAIVGFIAYRWVKNNRQA